MSARIKVTGKPIGLGDTKMLYLVRRCMKRNNVFKIRKVYFEKCTFNMNPNVSYVTEIKILKPISSMAIWFG